MLLFIFFYFRNLALFCSPEATPRGGGLFYFFIIFRRFHTLFTILTAGVFSSPDHFREEASRASLHIFLLSESSFISPHWRRHREGET